MSAEKVEVPFSWELIAQKEQELLRRIEQLERAVYPYGAWGNIPLPTPFWSNGTGCNACARTGVCMCVRPDRQTTCQS